MPFREKIPVHCGIHTKYINPLSRPNVNLLMWMTWKSEFEARWGQEFSLHVVQTGSGAHPASYPVRTGDSFPGGKAAGA
jgi:hypothetical protein